MKLRDWFSKLPPDVPPAPPLPKRKRTAKKKPAKRAKNTPAPSATPTAPVGFFSTDLAQFPERKKAIDTSMRKTFQRPLTEARVVSPSGEAVAMDSSGTNVSTNLVNTLKGAFTDNNGIPEAQVGWYGSQGFIGYQFCAMLAQNWLIDKVCTMPARDAVRMGWDINILEEDGLDEATAADALRELKKADKRYKLKKNIIQFSRFNRIFGIRHALTVVDSADPDYYAKPFNPDGITPGSYRGISQIDPYWIAPLLSVESASNPAAINFYEPEWWLINGKRVHHTHLIIASTGEVADLLKPSYLYGGVSVPQKIYERVYGAERTSNEAPLLAMTKRMTVLSVDMTEAMADQAGFEQKIQQWVYLQNNYGIKAIGGDEQVQQFDTSLADLDAVIMTQYQLVAAAGEVPGTKLMGTQPKGFSSTGEYEESSYHESLESEQELTMTPLMDRHYECVIRSDIMPKLGLAKPFHTEISWAPLDSPTAKEVADVNLTRAQTGAVLITSGAISGEDERNRLINDPDSGYNGLAQLQPEDPMEALLGEEVPDGDQPDADPEALEQ